MNGSYIIGVDIDGVIAPDPWRRFKKEEFQKLRCFGAMIRVICILVYYFTRLPYQGTKELLKRYKNNNYKIVIISGIWGITKPFLWLWLKIHRVPFDKLLLRWKGSVILFKTKALLSCKCEVFLDDNLELILSVRETLQKNNLQTRIIFYVANYVSFYILYINFC